MMLEEHREGIQDDLAKIDGIINMDILGYTF